MCCLCVVQLYELRLQVSKETFQDGKTSSSSKGPMILRLLACKMFRRDCEQTRSVLA